MADWRSSEPNKPKKSAKPTKPTDQVDFPPVSTQPTGGWRGNNKRTKDNREVSSSASRSWHGTADSTPSASTAFGKWLKVILLTTTAVVLAVTFLTWIFFRAPKLPLLVFAVSRYDASKELLENPFANSQRVKFSAANQGNITTHSYLNSAGDDNALSQLSTDAWLNSFDSVSISGRSIKPGGPDSRVVAFYINAYASFTPNSDLRLYSQQSNPFALSNLDKRGLKLEEALESIAGRIPNGRLAWVILDLQLPFGIANLDNLDPPWQTAGKQALKALDEKNPALSKRLLLTLPGKDGQQNWLAPELHGSFFGHYTLELLEGRGRDSSILNTHLTVSEFQKQLDERVSNRVVNRRFALQNPVWIPEATLEAFSKTSIVNISKSEPLSLNAPEDAKERFNAIDLLWNDISTGKNQRGYRWDPLGYAKVEAQLLALEDIAIHRPNSFADAKNLVDKMRDEMHKPADQFGVSLIEDRQRDSYFHGEKNYHPYRELDALAKRFANGLSKSEDDLPDFWKSLAGSEAAPPKAKLPDAKLSQADRPFLLWQFYVEASQPENEACWSRVFSRNRLETALQYAGDSESEWLEVYLLRRIAQDIDWELPVRERERACADALRTFQRLQTICTKPDPELSWWAKEDLGKIETEFLTSFDQLLANQTDEAIKGFADVSNKIKPFESTIEKLSDIIVQAQEAVHVLPHLLAWRAAEYQFVQEQGVEDVKARLEDLGRLAGLTQTFYELLALKPSNLSDMDVRLIETGSELREAIEKQKKAFNEYVEGKTAKEATGAASNNAQTFRRERVVLQAPAPLLTSEARKTLHSNTSAFLNSNVEELQEEGDQRIPPQRSGSTPIAVFLDSINGNQPNLNSVGQVRKRWESIVKTDLRYSGLNPFDQVAEPNGDSRPTKDARTALRSSLLSEEYWQRCYASAYGSYPTLHVELTNKEKNPWPWSCAWNRWALADANYRLWQASRLAEASWGRGRFDNSTPSQSFYFYQLGERYRIPNPFGSSTTFGKLTNSFQEEMDAIRKQKAERLRTLKLGFGSENQRLSVSGGKVPVFVSQSPDWNCVAQVFMGPIGKRLPWQPSKSLSDRTLVVDLRSPETLHPKEFDAKYWQGSDHPWGNLSIRGNLISNPIKWRLTGDVQNIIFSMNRPQSEGASLRILPPKEKPSITVLMLIDCSDSMDTQVSRLREGKKTVEPTRIFELVKNNAKALIQELGDIHDREANVTFGLIPFGLRDKNLGSSSGVLQKIKEELYRTKEIKLLDAEWQGEMQDLVTGLKASGVTPLYIAIDSACKIAIEEMKDRPNDRAFIYVLSDGVNSDEQSTASIKNTIKANKQLRLSIFHYDYFKTWLATSAEERLNSLVSRGEIKESDKPDERERLLAEYKRGIEELNQLGKELANEQYGYYQSNEAERLMRESLAIIPKSLVSVQSVEPLVNKPFKVTNQLINQEILVQNDFLPGEFRIELKGPNTNASGVVQLLGGEQLEVGIEQNRLTFGRFDPRGCESQRGKPQGEGLTPQAYLKTLRDKLATSNELGFELDFVNSSAGSSFTRRPMFIVAELSKTDDSKGTRFILADHRFMAPPNWSPGLQLNDVPWPADLPQATLRVWASDSLPTNHLQIVKLSPGDASDVELGKAKIHLAHSGSKLRADVTYEPSHGAQDRVVIICPDFFSAQRIFATEGSEETHEFNLPDKLHGKPSNLQLTTIRKLEEAVKARQVTEYVFDAIELDK